MSLSYVLFTSLDIECRTDVATANAICRAAGLSWHAITHGPESAIPPAAREVYAYVNRLRRALAYLSTRMQRADA